MGLAIKIKNKRRTMGFKRSINTQMRVPERVPAK